jgi:hypothetical protein
VLDIPPPLPRWAFEKGGDPERVGAKKGTKIVIKKGVAKTAPKSEPTGMQAVLAEMRRRNTEKSSILKTALPEPSKPTPKKKKKKKGGKMEFVDVMDELAYKLSRMKDGPSDEDDEDDEEEGKSIEKSSNKKDQSTTPIESGQEGTKQKAKEVSKSSSELSSIIRYYTVFSIFSKTFNRRLSFLSSFYQL